MSNDAIADLVKDWGGFERLVAQLHETGTVTVEHNAILQGRSGCSRQVDVLVRHQEGLYEHLIVVECKYRNAPIERLHVDALATTIREVGASKGVIFSTEGFQRGAIKQAQHENIALFKVREPTDEEWGLPGRHIDLWLQMVSIGIGNPSFPGAVTYAPPRGLENALRLGLGYPEHETKTPIVVEGLGNTTIEKLVDRLARNSAREAYRPLRLNFDGADEGEAKAVTKVKFSPKEGMRFTLGAVEIVAPELHFDLGIKLHQSRIKIDRAEGYAFVLALEDCVRNVVSTASRDRESEITRLDPVQKPDVTSDDAFVNGSILTVWLGPYEQFSEFAGLQSKNTSESKLKLDAKLLFE